MAAGDSQGWYTWLNILKEVRTGANRKPLVACPNDGEPLRDGPDGSRFCTYDGFRTDGGSQTV
jgi:hypothetical protein